VALPCPFDAVFDSPEDVIHQARDLLATLICSMFSFELSRSNIDDGEEPSFVLKNDLKPSVSDGVES